MTTYAYRLTLNWEERMMLEIALEHLIESEDFKKRGDSYDEMINYKQCAKEVKKRLNLDRVQISGNNFFNFQEKEKE